jgi:hypothetical protein
MDRPHVPDSELGDSLLGTKDVGASELTPDVCEIRDMSTGMHRAQTGKEG